MATGLIIPDSDGYLHDPDPEDSIAIKTRSNKRIKNANYGKITPLIASEIKDYRRRFPPTSVHRRTEAIICYNCHGMTFGSRRSRIFDSADIRLILNEDGYESIQRRDVTPGDIILYVKQNGDIEHSGVVVYTNLDQIPFCPGDNGDVNNFLILSKCGFGEEIIHRETMCPYNGTREFWRAKHDLP